MTCAGTFVSPQSIRGSLLVVGLAASAPWCALAQSVDAASCITVPASVPAQQVRANGTVLTVASGTYALTTVGAPAFYAANAGVIPAGRRGACCPPGGRHHADLQRHAFLHVPGQQ